MKITLVNKNFSASIEDKTSQGGKDYKAVSVCQSFKNKDGEYEKKYFNMFQEDIGSLIGVLTALQTEFVIQNTAEIFGNSKPNNASPVDTSMSDEESEDLPF